MLFSSGTTGNPIGGCKLDAAPRGGEAGRATGTMAELGTRTRGKPTTAGTLPAAPGCVKWDDTGGWMAPSSDSSSNGVLRSSTTPATRAPARASAVCHAGHMRLRSAHDEVDPASPGPQCPPPEARASAPSRLDVEVARVLRRELIGICIGGLRGDPALDRAAIPAGADATNPRRPHTCRHPASWGCRHGTNPPWPAWPPGSPTEYL